MATVTAPQAQPPDKNSSQQNLLWLLPAVGSWSKHIRNRAPAGFLHHSVLKPFSIHSSVIFARLCGFIQSDFFTKRQSRETFLYENFFFCEELVCVCQAGDQ